MNQNEEIVLYFLNQQKINNVDDFAIQTFNDIKAILYKYDFETENLIIENIESVQNNEYFFGAKILNNQLIFELFYKQKNQYYLINKYGNKQIIKLNYFYEQCINSFLHIQQRKNISLILKPILKDTNFKHSFLIAIGNLFINLLTLSNGIFLTILSKYVLQASTFINFWWILLCFMLLFGIRILTAYLLDLFVKKIIKNKFYKWYMEIWKNILKQPKNFFNESTNLFNINEFIVNLINFNTCSWPIFYINVLTCICGCLLLLLIDFWFLIISFISCLFIIFISFIKRKFQKQIFNQNLNYENQEKNLINLLSDLKNNFYCSSFYNSFFSYLNQYMFNNYEFNLKYSLKNERWSIFSMITIQLLNVLMLIVLILNNINNLIIVSNYFLIININKLVVNGIENCLHLFIKLPEIKQQAETIDNISNSLLNSKGFSITKIQNVTLTKPKFKNLIINQEIEINNATCLVGPSGIGKSYLLWSICNQTHDFEIKINNICIQNFISNELNDLIIYLNNNTPLIISNFQILLEEIEYQDLINEFLKNNHLTINDIFAQKISSGQKQMLNLLNLLILKNKFLLLDEVMSNLDTQSIIYFNTHILPIIKKNNLILLVTHNPLIIKEFQSILNLYEFIQENHHSFALLN